MIEILDSTLREGEQTPYVTFSVEEKIKIAQLLDEFGVDIIEAGHPIVSDDICQSVKMIFQTIIYDVSCGCFSDGACYGDDFGG